MSDASESLLRAMLTTLARQTFPENTLREIVLKRGGKAQLLAFNMCDGTKTQADIAKAQGLDPGNFSRTLARWEDAGVIFRVGPEDKPLHVYRLRPDGTTEKDRSK